MYLRVVLCALCVASQVHASEWSREEADGVVTASITLGELSYIEALCDVGINIPITSLSFMIHGNVPNPEERIEFRFGDRKKIFAMTDFEGVIASATLEEGQKFDQILEEMRSNSDMIIRLQSGIRETFSLSGSEDALAGCVADAQKLAEETGS